jgi:hypothetical protein
VEQDLEAVPSGRLQALSAIAKLTRGILIVAVGIEPIWGRGRRKSKKKKKKKKEQSKRGGIFGA